MRSSRGREGIKWPKNISRNKNAPSKDKASTPTTSCGKETKTIAKLFEIQQQKWDSMFSPSVDSAIADCGNHGNNGELDLTPVSSCVDFRSKYLNSVVSKNGESYDTEKDDSKQLHKVDLVTGLTSKEISGTCDFDADENLSGDKVKYDVKNCTPICEKNCKQEIRRRNRLSLKRKISPPLNEKSQQNEIKDCIKFEISSVSSSVCSLYSIDSTSKISNDSLRSSSSEVDKLSDMDKRDSNISLDAQKSSFGESLSTSQSSSLDNDKDQRVPYYLENFLIVINAVINDPFYTNCFNVDDVSVVQKFGYLVDVNAQKLYARLYMRKHKWLQKDKIIYPHISGDLSDILNTLVDAGFLMDASQMTDLTDVLNCLAAPELKALAKTLHIDSTASKSDLISSILTHSQRNSISSYFTTKAGLTDGMVLSRAKKLLGQCYKLEAAKRSTFLRIMMLSALHNTIGDDDFSGQQQIFQMLMTMTGVTKYPDYKILRKTRVFPDRESVFRYGTVLEMECVLWASIEKKNYHESYKLYEAVKVAAREYLNDPEEPAKRDGLLPLHLRIYTTSAAYVRMLSRGVNVLQFLKRYQEAVEQLQELLAQMVFHPDYRGKWYDRLTLNLDFHLKQPITALEIIKEALADSFVRTGYRFTLLQRAKKICSSSAGKKSGKPLWSYFEDDVMNVVQDAPTVTIIGYQSPHSVPGTNPMWVTKDSYQNESGDVTVITRVEEVALRHYADSGYPEGIHGEGGTFTALFMLFMWDIVFMDGIQDVFYNSFQLFPLDIFSDSFYSSRERSIVERLELIAHSTVEILCAMASQVWNQHKDTLCFGINWEYFRDCAHMEGLVKCMGGVALSGIFDRLSKLMRFTTGGVPDLVVWNPDTCRLKVVEVKGPGDRLSMKQVLWLDYLLKLGVDAEVCYVKAVGAKKLST